MEQTRLLVSRDVPGQ